MAKFIDLNDFRTSLDSVSTTTLLNLADGEDAKVPQKPGPPRTINARLSPAANYHPDPPKWKKDDIGALMGNGGRTFVGSILWIRPLPYQGRLIGADRASRSSRNGVWSPKNLRVCAREITPPRNVWRPTRSDTTRSPRSRPAKGFLRWRRSGLISKNIHSIEITINKYRLLPQLDLAGSVGVRGRLVGK